MQTPLHILQTYWKHEHFRPLQEEIVQTALDQRDALVLLPTGGGKSICYQVPALAQEGICLVISPLVALMKDQVNALQQKGVKAIALSSGIPHHELDTLLDNCIYGNYKFLYLSPERLQQELVQDRIKQMPINLIAVDEAHCISQWGNDFRPAYKQIKLLRDMLPHVPCMALTATATKQVVKDIATELELFQPKLFQQSFKRDNIRYVVLQEEDKHNKLKQLLSKQPESAIVYVRSRKLTLELSAFLNQQGISALAFHGGLSTSEKETRMQQWLQNQVQVMVATNAFGMGIDKPDVKTIIHFNLPESIESYYQEAGRVGRNGEPAWAIILMNQSDTVLVKNQFLSVLPQIDVVKLVYRKLCSYFQIPYGEGEDQSFDFNFSHFCQVYQFNGLLAFNALQVLDRTSIISLSNNFQKRTALQFIVSNHTVLEYLDSHEKLSIVVKSILRTYGGIFEQKLHISTDLLAKKTGVPEQQFLQALKTLEKDGLIDLTLSETDTEITFIEPREDDRNINRIAKTIEQQNNLKTKQVHAVLDYVQNTDLCKQTQLLSYFGETEAKACGHCSVCAKAKPKKASVAEVRNHIIQILEQGDVSSKSLVESLPFDEQSIIQMLQLLLEHQIICLTKQNTYKLSHL